MSAIIGLIAAAVVRSVILPAGTKLVRRTLEKYGPVAGNLARQQAIATDHANIRSIKSLSQIRSAFKPFSSQFPRPNNVEEAKQQIMAEIASQPFYTSDEVGLSQKLEALKKASTVNEVELAGKDLSSSINNGHHAVFAGVVKDACQRASMKIGFSKIEALPSRLRSGVIRFAATDAKGRTLVTEIDTPKNRDVKIETEVLGVNDNSCHQILDEFHAALEAEGVSLGGPPKREGTGGICTLAAAKMFAGRRPASVKDTSKAARSRGSKLENEERRKRLNRAAQKPQVKLQVSQAISQKR